jgi:copper(I)-binding protein
MFRSPSTPLALAATACLLAAAPAGAQVASLRFSHPWIATPPNGAATAAGYVSVTNAGSQPDRLTGGASPAFDRIEVHQMSMGGGMMTMRQIPGLDIAAGRTLTLAPGGGYHLMLIHPRHALRPGEHVPATLHFQRAGDVRVDFVVQ